MSKDVLVLLMVMVLVLALAISLTIQTYYENRGNYERKTSKSGKEKYKKIMFYLITPLQDEDFWFVAPIVKHDIKEKWYKSYFGQVYEEGRYSFIPLQYAYGGGITNDEELIEYCQAISNDLTESEDK